MDKAFEDLLAEIFGAETMASFKSKRPLGYIDLMIAFESRKRSCSPHKISPLNIALPFSFIDFYKKNKGKDLSWYKSEYSRHRMRISAFGGVNSGYVMRISRCLLV